MNGLGHRVALLRHLIVFSLRGLDLGFIRTHVFHCIGVGCSSNQFDTIQYQPILCSQSKSPYTGEHNHRPPLLQERWPCRKSFHYGWYPNHLS